MALLRPGAHADGSRTGMPLVGHTPMPASDSVLHERPVGLVDVHRPPAQRLFMARWSSLQATLRRAATYFFEGVRTNPKRTRNRP